MKSDIADVKKEKNTMRAKYKNAKVVLLWRHAVAVISYLGYLFDRKIWQI